MRRKRQEYFAAGTQAVWELNPVTREMAVYSDVDEFQTIPADGAVTGGVVLPGFSLKIAAIFALAPPMDE